ncbi:hypothetical protein [Fictibacillus norfolkensis]|uniref:Uncharacterized protein n=1 Tax=Fictibacillus norfolkensis TaxID=2762233 RepID=A0ABR8SGE2_9BACL|nr:hypothetical protein [Fictibacillus norfolkensis]MBD7962522.1 hypothetical protein [Fictibacillus norfolkensis]
MYEDKGILTEEELVLLSRYADDKQVQLNDELLKAKAMPKSLSYERWIEHLEQGLFINFNRTNKVNVVTVGKLNIARLDRVLLEMTN